MQDLFTFQPPTVEAGSLVAGDRADRSRLFLRFETPEGQATVLIMSRARAIALAKQLNGAIRATLPPREPIKTKPRMG